MVHLVERYPVGIKKARAVELHVSGEKVDRPYGTFRGVQFYTSTAVWSWPLGLKSVFAIQFRRATIHRRSASTRIELCGVLPPTMLRCSFLILTLKRRSTYARRRGTRKMIRRKVTRSGKDTKNRGTITRERGRRGATRKRKAKRRGAHVEDRNIGNKYHRIQTEEQNHKPKKLCV